jgi:thiamine pyrophosphate-dependent acetolactate synthase large subunit-like protein
MSDENEIDNIDNVLVFTKRFDANSDIKEMRNFIEDDKPKQHCSHTNIRVSEFERKVTCRHCGTALEALDYLLSIAKGETKLDWELRMLRSEIKDHREGLEKLKREEVNCRARIKTAQFRLNELNIGIYKAEKENG